MFQADVALRVPFHTSGCETSWPVPWCTIFTCSGNSFLLASRSPAEVSKRRKCFMATVSPARSKLRSNTLCARAESSRAEAVGRLKRHGSMPFCQSLKTKAVSTLPWASALRALTKNSPADSASPSASRAQLPGGSSRLGTRASPWASVRPSHRRAPLQSLMATSAPSTGLALSSVVTQTSAFSRPVLK